MEFDKKDNWSGEDLGSNLSLPAKYPRFTASDMRKMAKTRAKGKLVSNFDMGSEWSNYGPKVSDLSKPCYLQY